jgi:plastocyanin
VYSPPVHDRQITLTQPATANESISNGAAKQSAGQKYFEPAALSVKVGTTVIWTNNDGVAHTVTSGDPNAGPSGTFDSGLIKPTQTFKYSFTAAGTTSYFCTVHPWMTGKVTAG